MNWRTEIQKMGGDVSMYDAVLSEVPTHWSRYPLTGEQPDLADKYHMLGYLAEAGVVESRRVYECYPSGGVCLSTVEYRAK